MTETKKTPAKTALVKLKRAYFPVKGYRVEGEYIEPTTCVRGKVAKGLTIEIPVAEAKRAITLGIAERADEL